MTRFGKKMPLYTPRGLKLRVSKSYAFALMARLHGKETPFRVLQLTEDFENLASLGATTAALVALYYRVGPYDMALACFITEVALKLVHYLGIFVPPITFLLPVSRCYSVVAGYGVMLLALSITCYVVGGWWLVAGMLGGRIAAAIVGGILEIFYMKRTKTLVGFPVTGSERSFFHAYRLLASKHGVTTDLNVSDEESASETWMPTYMELAISWPVVVSRFSEE